MEPNYMDMSVDSLEASMAREILEASIREAAEPRQVPTPATSKTDSETPKGTNDNDHVDQHTSKPLDQSLNLMDLSLGPALTAGSSVESPNLGPATFSTQHETGLEVTDAGVGDEIKQLDETPSRLNLQLALDEDGHKSEVEEEHQQPQQEPLVEEKELQQQQQQEVQVEDKEQQQQEQAVEVKEEKEEQQQPQQAVEVDEEEEQQQQQPQQAIEVEEEEQQHSQQAVEVEDEEQQQPQQAVEVEDEEQQQPQQAVEVEDEEQQQPQQAMKVDEKEQQHEVQTEVKEEQQQPQELSLSNNEQATTALEANVSTIDDIKRESALSVAPAEDTEPASEISSDSSKSDASDQRSQDKAKLEEEFKEETRVEAEEELKEEVKDKEEDENDDEESCESDRVILDDDCSEEDEELSIDQTQQQPSFQTAAGGHSVAVDPSITDQSNTTNYMEFTKNYSDDLLMGGGGQSSGGEGGQHGHDMMPNADLADFELPPYSGSSSGSENQQQQQQSSSPIKSSQAQASSSATSSSRSHTNTQVSPPSLTAVIELLMASYSRGAHLLQWKRPIETGVIFGIGATFIMALTFFSIISVIAYSALGLILASASIRLYKTLMKTLNKSTDTPVDHIWNKVLALNVSISSDKLYELVEASHGNLNSSLAYFKQVLLIEDKIAAIKFGIFLYILTYIGSWFNGMTLITISYLALFSVPLLYQQNKTKIDELLNLITGQMSSTIGMVTSRVSALAFGGSASDSKKKN